MSKSHTRRQALQTLAVGGLGAALAGQFTPGLAQTAPKWPAFQSRRSLANSIHFGAHLFSILADKKATGGAYSLIDATVRQGFEAPPHTHTKEDEIFFVLEGEVEFTSGGIVTLAKPGDHVFQPRNVEHWFKLKTPTARALVMFTPGGLEGLYRQLSVPAKTLELPAPPTAVPTAEQIERSLKLSAEYGVFTAPPKK
jgi:quercetin dioxygenase-like cupin family protein